MAFGRHWEWRGFGLVGSKLAARVARFEAIHPRPQQIVDRYFWTPGCRWNIKLRPGEFKIKRPLDRRADGIEEWVEDEKECFPFPLDGSVLTEVASALGIRPPRVLPARISTPAELIDALRSGGDRIEEIVVEKTRSQYHVPGLEGLIVELARIERPELCESIGLEHEDAALVARGIERLGLPGEFPACNYLDASEIWARGGSVLDRPGQGE
jgi:hypothetical protein